MISFFVACSSQVEQGENKAAVCSTPPSEVGTGITVLEDMLAEVWVRGRKYIYIWVVKRFGRLVGVIQRVKGSSASIRSISLNFITNIGCPTCVYNSPLLLHPFPEFEFPSMDILPSSFPFRLLNF
jgi:hypothetical protein